MRHQDGGQGGCCRNAACWVAAGVWLGLSVCGGALLAEEHARPVRDTVRSSLSKPGARPPGKTTSTSRGASAAAPAGKAERPEGTSSNVVRKQAAAAVPLDRLNRDQRARVEEILAEAAYFRRTPVATIDAPADVYRYFVQNPDASVAVWRAMDISAMSLRQVSDDVYEGDTGDGTAGRIEVLLRGEEQNLVLCTGQFKSPFLPRPIVANSLVLLETRIREGANGSTQISHRADLFVQFPSQTVETLAKILSPVTGGLVDHNFIEMSTFVRMMALAMERRPDWVEELTLRLDGVPIERRQELLDLMAHHRDPTVLAPVPRGAAPGNAPLTRGERPTAGTPARRN